MSYTIKLVDPDNHQEIAKCFCVFAVLRPHLIEANFVEVVRVQAKEGYRIAYIESDGEVVAATGFRVLHFLAWGKVMYIDDLITLPSKKRAGLGGALLDWLSGQRKLLDCDEIHLDTGFARHDAHRLYLNKGFTLNCHHLAKTSE
jgi:GNAT superfamily N-acetyltransferase